MTTNFVPFFKLSSSWIFNEAFSAIAGIAVLVAATFFGYMLALLQRRVGAMFSSRRVSNPSPYWYFFALFRPITL